MQGTPNTVLESGPNWAIAVDVNKRAFAWGPIPRAVWEKYNGGPYPSRGTLVSSFADGRWAKYTAAAEQMNPGLVKVWKDQQPKKPTPGIQMKATQPGTQVRVAPIVLAVGGGAFALWLGYRLFFKKK
jgi:hypothetical protein